MYFHLKSEVVSVYISHVQSERGVEVPAFPSFGRIRERGIGRKVLQNIQCGSTGSTPCSVVAHFGYVAPFGSYLSTPADVQRFYAVVLERHVTVLVIDRRSNQRIGYHHAPMRPAGVKTVVVIVVGTAGLVYGTFFWFVQAVQRTAHIGGLQELGTQPH